MESQDQEVTLGTGRLLGLFFGLVVVCALFFSLGFSLGRKATPAIATASILPEPAPATGAAPKPSSARADEAPKPENKSTSDELTFYKSVAQNDANAKLDPPTVVAAATPAATPMPKPVETRSAPEIARALASGYMVQIAAVTKQEDADALVSALRKKNYPVLSTTNPPSDKLYHVQVGPFADLKDAESTRSKLIGDGYNPILKK
ncbi:MAG: SPOR domain-containing protein [Terriglobales bacterium]